MLKISTYKVSSHSDQNDLDNPSSPNGKKLVYFSRFLLSFFVFFTPYLMIDKFYLLSIEADIIAIVVAVFLTFLATYILIKKTRKQQFSNSIWVESFLVKTNKVIRKSSMEEGMDSFYIDVYYEGQPKVLYLHNLHIQEKYMEGKFPSTEFEIIRDKESQQILEVKIKGRYFSPIDEMGAEHIMFDDCTVVD